SASISSRIASAQACITSRKRSGSSRSPSAVDPVTSAKRIVTTLRSSPPAALSTGDPQAGQNRAPSGIADPQTEHGAASGLPHVAQNRAPAALSEPHVRHLATGG